MGRVSASSGLGAPVQIIPSGRHICPWGPGSIIGAPGGSMIISVMLTTRHHYDWFRHVGGGGAAVV
jgi:hypothetical protein